MPLRPGRQGTGGEGPGKQPLHCASNGVSRGQSRGENRSPPLGPSGRESESRREGGMGSGEACPPPRPPLSPRCCLSRSGLLKTSTLCPRSPRTGGKPAQAESGHASCPGHKPIGEASGPGLSCDLSSHSKPHLVSSLKEKQPNCRTVPTVAHQEPASSGLGVPGPRVTPGLPGHLPPPHITSPHPHPRQAPPTDTCPAHVVWVTAAHPAVWF